MTEHSRNYKVIAVDNFDRELYSDRLIVDRIRLETAEMLVEDLNADLHDGSNWFHKAVPQDHKLYKFEP